MQDFTDPSEYLTGPRLFEHQDPQSVQDYLKKLTPQDVRIKVISKDYKGKTTGEGKYYGSQYNRRSLGPETKKWSGTLATGGVYSPLLTVPKPNELIPERFDLIGKPATDPKEKARLLDAPPAIIREDGKFTLYHKLDRSFSQPKVRQCDDIVIVIFSLIIICFKCCIYHNYFYQLSYFYIIIFIFLLLLLHNYFFCYIFTLQLLFYFSCYPLCDCFPSIIYPAP